MPDFRVDSAHCSVSTTGQESGEEPLIQLLQAVAGRDAVLGEQQILRQGEELDAYEPRRGNWTADQPDAIFSDSGPAAGTGAGTVRASMRDERVRGEEMLFQQELIRRRDQLERFHMEAERLYRDALEMRLISEQLWGEVLALIPATEARRRVEAIRRQLGSSFRQSEEHLSKRRAEISAAAHQVQTRLDELHATQREFAKWMTDRFRQLDRTPSTTEA